MKHPLMTLALWCGIAFCVGLPQSAFAKDRENDHGSGRSQSQHSGGKHFKGGSGSSNSAPRKIELPKQHPQSSNPGGGIKIQGNVNSNQFGGNQASSKRKDNDRKPSGKSNNPPTGGKNPNFGGTLPNFGGNQLKGKRNDDDSKPSGGPNLPNLRGNNPPRPRHSGQQVDKNPELKSTLRHFEPMTAKRRENERNLLRNQDQVDKLLNSNPRLKEKTQLPNGKVDLSKLHLEHGSKDRIPSIVHKNGSLPIKLDNGADLSKRFHSPGRVRDLNEMNDKLNHFRDPNVLKQHPELARIDFKHVSGQFQNQIAKNGFQSLVHSKVGNQLHLNQQFNLYQRGDVARKMNLGYALMEHGGWKHRYSGPIFAGFTSSSFSFWYAGGGYYPKYCWCPTWSPWVDWCWWNTCPIIYDPRPIFCRPYLYDPCGTWVYYQYPVWQPLPIVACGTWVDLPTPVLVDGVDLQLLAVRFVDNGHPDQNLGPRYRVWLQNNSNNGIAGAFNVLLMASNTPDGVADLPQSGVIVPSMEAGEMKVVDVRLPLAANKMNRVENHLTPFNYLHVLVDSHRQLPDVNPANNGAVLPRADILQVDPAAFAPDVSAAAPGAIVSIAGEGFGPEPGRLIVDVNGTQTEAMIYGWYDLGVQFEMPNVPLNGPTDADVMIVRGDGAASNPVTVRIAPENRLQEAALPPAPLP